MLNRTFDLPRKHILRPTYLLIVGERRGLKDAGSKEKFAWTAAFGSKVKPVAASATKLTNTSPKPIDL
jgi:hypothetical protein